MRILLVDDSPADIRLLERAFERCAPHIDTSSAPDGTSALRHLASHRGTEQMPTMIVLDLNLPDLTGREVLRQIRDDPHARNIPVLVLSSSDMSFDVEQSYAGGGSAYVRKPESTEDYDALARAIDGFWGQWVCFPG